MDHTRGHGGRGKTWVEAVGFYYRKHCPLRHNRQSSTLRFLDTVKSFSEFLKADVDLTAITEDHVESWLIQRKAQGISPVTRNTDLARLRSLFNFLKRKGWIEFNPASDVGKFPVPRRDVSKLVTVDEARSFVGWLTVNGKLFYRDLVVVCAETGCRVGELLAVQKAEDVDLQEGWLYFRNRGVHGPKRGNEHAVRLNLQAAQVVARRMALPGLLLFGGEDDKPILVSSVGHRIKKYARKAGVPQFTIHLMRHLWRSTHEGKVPSEVLNAFASHGAQAARSYIHPVLMDLKPTPTVL